MVPHVGPRQEEDRKRSSFLRMIGTSLAFWMLWIVFGYMVFHAPPAWAGELHTSVLVKDIDDSFVCSASNITNQTLHIEIVIISGGTPPEDIFRQTLTCGPKATCLLGTSPGDARTAAQCSIFFHGPRKFVWGVLRTFTAKHRAEAQ